MIELRVIRDVLTAGLKLGSIEAVGGSSAGGWSGLAGFRLGTTSWQFPCSIS
jgi:hypothetical protein